MVSNIGNPQMPTVRLGGGFKDFLFSSRKLGKMIPILTSIFFQVGWFNHQVGNIDRPGPHQLLASMLVVCRF